MKPDHTRCCFLFSILSFVVLRNDSRRVFVAGAWSLPFYIFRPRMPKIVDLLCRISLETVSSWRANSTNTSTACFCESFTAFMDPRDLCGNRRPTS